MLRINKILYVLAVMIFTAVSGFSQGTVDLTLKGKLLGSDGQPMGKADIYVFDDGMTYYNTSVPKKVNDDGTFSLKLSKAGNYIVTFTGLGYSSFPITLPLFDKKGEVEIVVKLSAVKTQLTKNTIGFKSNACADYYMPEMVQKATDGKFHFVVKKALDTLLLQVVPKPYNTGAGFKYPNASYLFDSTGNYYTTFFKVKAGFEIVLDPQTLPKIEGSNLANISFLKDDIGLKAAYEVAEKSNIDNKEANLKNFYYYLDLFKNSNDKTVRDYAAVRLYEFHQYADYPLVDNIEEVTAYITPQNVAWSKYFYSIRDVIESRNIAEQAKYVEDMFNGQGLDVKMYVMYFLKEKNTIVSKEKYTELYEKYKQLATDEKYSYSITDLKPPVPLKDQTVLDFKVKMINGKDFSPKDLAGKYYLIDFWGTWCMPCVGEIPNLEKAYAKFKSKGFEIISLAFGTPEEDFKAQIKTTPMPWLHALLNDEDSDKLAQLYNVEYIPKMLLVAPDGSILANEETLRDGGLYKLLEEKLK